MKRGREKFLICMAFIVLVLGLSVRRPGARAGTSDEIRAQIEQAMFDRREFFGANALFPRPTAEASERLARLAADLPDDPGVLQALAGTQEQLERFDEAEKDLVHLAAIDPARADELSSFYHRRARFADEAKLLAGLLSSPAVESKETILKELLDLARVHDLKEYKQPAFYDRVIAENPDVFSVFEEFADRLTEEKNFTAALDLVRNAKSRFPAQRTILLEKEISLLLQTNRYKEAEGIYVSGYDPFWNDEESDKFYNFLSEHDRLREYGAELKNRFAKDPGDFGTAIKLAGYRDYRGDGIMPVIAKLQKAKTVWTTDELVTVTRLLLGKSEGSLASRFLYTLYARNDFKNDPDLRARVLYQLFEMFSDAETQKLPMTTGDLRFYEEIAKTDTDPGITTGILSLIFSDSDPQGQLREREIRANKYFNRAAAYKIFIAYRDEFPASPELYQMYLDLVRLYTATKETDIAGQVLDEFAEKYHDSKDYGDAALKLADALDAVGDHEKSRNVCRDILDYLGKQGQPQPTGAIFPTDGSRDFSSPSAHERNFGINIPSPSKKDHEDFDDHSVNFNDHLREKNAAVSYPDVLGNLVSSLAREKKTSEILELYSSEIAKYPQAEWLYEQRLSWLEKTNLTEEQLAVYREALSRFQTTTWSDKLARWFIRQNRQSDLAELSNDLVGKLSDSEVQAYLGEMIDPKMSALEFEKQMYFQLYTSAHRRFPHNIAFVQGLLRYYRETKQDAEWQKLAVEYYFISPDIRLTFLDHLAAAGSLRSTLAGITSDDLAYRIFSADAAMRLSNFEQAVATYRELNGTYPNSPEISARLIDLSRSLGQKDAPFSSEAAGLAFARADHTPSSAEFRTASGEIFAENGDIRKSRDEWKKLIATGEGDRETYLDTATVYWDYFQYYDALQTIDQMRKKFSDGAAYAFEAGAIYEELHKPEKAVHEYVTALGSREDDEEKDRAEKRLETLARKEDSAAMVRQAYLGERSMLKDPSYLDLGYADFLTSIKKEGEAVSILARAIAQSRDDEFLASVLDVCSSRDLQDGERQTLSRLSEVSNSPRRKIKYNLRLARSYEDVHDRDSAKRVLSSLVRNFPTNYGVITETSDFCRRLGFETESAGVLKDALARSRGVYKNELAAKLSKRLVDLNRLDEAAQILTRLHAEDPADPNLFRELASVYVRRSDPGGLRKAFSETVASLKASDVDRRELDDQIADLRTQMIDAFTRLKDYGAAVEQHIEIINREPENEDLTENAIAYTERYGGSDTLLRYYQKTSAEAFKNYRWNVVLARIFEAKGDFENAVRNYNTAIDNQPEMSDLFEARADLRVKQGDFDSALKDIDTVLEMTGNDAEKVKKKIEILKRAGRSKEAGAERAKLPPAVEPEANENVFDAARARQNTEKEEARRLYREAFDWLFADPLSGELKGSNIVDYVRSVRDEEPLDKISLRLWNLRLKFIGLASEAESTRAGEARNRLMVLDGAIPASIGEIAGSVATDEELAAIHSDLKNRIDDPLPDDQYRTLDEIIDISRRAHMGDLEEMVLRKKIARAVPGSASRKAQVDALAGFYTERGAYERALAAREEFGSDDAPALAHAARLAGNNDKENAALRSIYSATGSAAGPSQEQNVARYLQVLYDGDRTELDSLTHHSSSYRLQLINFLLGKGEFDLAQAAVQSAEMPNAWKRSRRAEIDLALKHFSGDERCDFCEALQTVPIGEMIAQNTDKREFPVGDDWYRLGFEYGEWLSDTPRPPVKPSLYLTAMLENQPRNSEQQKALGTFYLHRKEPARAVGHFQMAVELAPDDKAASADLAATYLLFGDAGEGDKIRKTAFQDADPAGLLIFFREFEKFGLAIDAAKRVSPGIVKYLESADIDDSDDMQALVREIAASFRDDKQKALYFRAILDRRPTDTSLAAILLDESLIEPGNTGPFYERLITASDGFDYDEDYSFQAIAKRTWSAEDAESLYDQENEYKIEEPENERYSWQKRFLESLIVLNQSSDALKLTGEIEKELKGKFARPAWLRLAKLRLEARSSRVDLHECERFIGINVSDSSGSVIPPNLERFNDVTKMLREERHEDEAIKLSAGYFARMLALDQFEPANFAGLARALFAGGDTGNAMGVVRLMADIGDNATRESALAGVAALDIVRSHLPDSAKVEEQTAGPEPQNRVLSLAAVLSAEFGKPDTAIEFRRLLADIDPANEENAIALSKLFVSNAKGPDAIDILRKLIANKNTSRISRWRAKWELREMGETIEIEDFSYDAYSQYYVAVAGEKGRNDSIPVLVNALITGGDEDKMIERYLVRSYALAGKPYAALSLAESDKGEKPEELLSLLSSAAETTGNYSTAIEYEKLKHGGGSIDRINALQVKADTSNRRATDLFIDAGNTRKL